MKKKDLVEVIFHARSGQGAKTAAQFIAEASLAEGKEFQSFAEYGAERAGAPMKTFARISRKPIRTHEPVVDPDIAVVLDPSLTEYTNLCEGLEPSDIFLINSPKPSAYFKKKLKCKARVYAVDATGISVKLLGKDFPNMPLLGAIIKLTKVISLNALTESINKKYLKKIGDKMTQANIQAAKAGYDAVKVK